jgi:DNA-directed RNA polymerase subunit L
MKINIANRETGYVEMDFSGEGHTLLNLLQSSLLENDNVEMTGYSKPHPLMDRSRLFIRLRKGDDIMGTLKKATDNAELKLDEFLEQFEKSLSEF